MTTADRYGHLSPLKRALLALDDLKARLDDAERARNEPIAVVGLGCRIPGAPDPDGFWTLLREGRSAVREVPRDRWNIDEFYDPDPDAPGKMCTRSAAFLDRIDLFDAQFFGISPREAASMDPQQRLFLEVCWEALEHAGMAPDGLSGSPTGVFAGIASGDYADLMKAHGHQYLDGHFASGVAHSIVSGRLSYILGLQGPSLSIDTACSSSLVAVHLACQSLRAGDCRMAIAGGVNLMITPENSVLFSKSQMLARDGRCKTFDAAADGFARGEGCGVVVLKRFSDATADGDRILALIRGSATNQDGPSSGLTAPNGPSQVAVMREALKRAGIEPSDVDYVEAHGTGTSLGDPIEVQALGVVHAGRPTDRPLAIGSLKTNVGHLEAAAGVAGLIKLVLSLQHEAIPAHLHLTRPNPHVAWEELPIAIVTALTPWPRGSRPRFGGVSSFGFSGTNVHVVVQEGPQDDETAPALERPAHLLTLSARTEAALAARARDLAASVESSTAALADVAFTANVGRAQMTHRAGLVAGSRQELKSRLERLAAGDPSDIHVGRVAGSDRLRIGMLFTGQGAQYAGMARELFETQPTFRCTIERCDEILRSDLDRSLLSVLFPDDGAPSPIDETLYTQPALFAVDYAIAALWRAWGIEPAAVMGHSLGEFVAACHAGVFSLEDALRLVAARGRLMQRLPAGGAMASVFGPESRVAAAAAPYAGKVAIAAVNHPSQTVISGEGSAVGAVLDTLAAEGITSKRLVVSHAFHSPLMAPMVKEFETVARTVTHRAPRIPLVSNVSGTAAGPEVAAPEYWVRHVLTPVRFADGVAAMAALGVKVFLEAGPNATLLGLASRCLGGDGFVWLPSLRKGRGDWAQVLDTTAQLYVRGAPLDWRAFDRDYRRHRVSLPTYPFERERHWITDRAAPRRTVETQARHPILQRSMEIANSHNKVYEGAATPETLPWLFDHRVHGTVIMPGAAFLEMAFAAADLGWGSGAHRVEDVVIHQPLVVDETAGARLQVVVAEEEGGRATMEVFSSSLDQESADWLKHAEGRLVREGRTGSAVAAPPIADCRAACTRAIAPDLYYRDLRSRGLELGPAFQGLDEIHAGGAAALGRVVLPAAAGGADGFLVHPVLLDLAIQTVGAAVADAARGDHSSYLPFALETARRDPTAGPVVWAQAVPRGRPTADDTLLADVFLRDAEGRMVAALEGLRLKRADRDLLRRRHAASTSSWLYEITWQPQSRAQEAHGVAQFLPPLTEVAGTIRQRVAAIAAEQRLTAFEDALPHLEALSIAYVVDALTAIGVSFEPGQRLDGREIAERAGVGPSYQRLLGRLLEILAEEGVLHHSGEGWVVQRIPAQRDPSEWFRSLQARYGVPLEAELALLGRCGPKLADVLQGRADPLSLLFPEGSSRLAENLYQVSPAARAFNQILAEALERALEGVPPVHALRVLEIGGGTGSTSSFVLPRLRPESTEYVFTDISPAFTARAAEKFAAYPFVSYRALDIERDPSEQGFRGQRFDVIIAANVLHATRDLAETFAHVRQLLAPGGLVVMLEMVRPQRWIDLTFGLTSGWWRFTDRALRPAYPLLGHAAWKSFLEAGGFREVVAVPGHEGEGIAGIESAFLARGPSAENRLHSGEWLIVGDTSGTACELAAILESRGHRCTVVASPDDDQVSSFASQPGARGVVHLAALEADGREAKDLDALRAFQDRLCGGIVRMVQRLAATTTTAPLTLVTRGGQPVPPTARPDPGQATLWGMGRVIALEHPELGCRRIDLDPESNSLNELAAELLHGDGEDQIAFRGAVRYVARLSPHRGETPATDAASERPEIYRLDIPRRGTFDDLKLAAAIRRSPGPGEVEIRIRATALNFRDVMNVLGTYPGDPGPLGSECAGEVAAVGSGVDHLSIGDEVVALAGDCFANYLTTPATFVVRCSPLVDVQDAVTVPIAYVTAYFALHHRGGLKRGERVLIHAAAGGVGLAAVHLALRAGAEVFATAGSPEKQEHLASLGVRHVMSSRALTFADEILERTGGRGVDIVLNSLAGDSIAPSFEALASGGRFLELGKSGWTAAQVAALGKDIILHVIDWTVDANQDPGLVQSMLSHVMDLVARGDLPTLPRRAFPIAEVRDAFRFMAQARHIGKVIVTHPEKSIADIVRREGAYLITGGLGGLGLLTARWLVDRGAGSLVLMGRREPSAEARAVLEELKRRGARVAVVGGDVSREVDVAAALAQAGPSLRGIVHSAGTLDDGLLMQQDGTRFERVLAPKAFGAFHLDRLTRDRQLDFFVMYSSVAAVFGSVGQSNHAAANSYLDVLAHRRRAEGRPALSVNWGVWSEIGAAVRLGVDKRSREQGIGTIDPARGLAVLERLLEGPAAQVTVCPIDWARYAEQIHGRSRPRFFSAVLPQVTGPSARPAAAVRPETPALSQRLEECPPDGRRRVLLGHVRDEAVRVLALPTSRPVDPEQPLHELGLDSLMAVELRNILSASVGRPLPATLLFDYPTIEALASYLGREVFGWKSVAGPALVDQPPVTQAETIIERIEDLSDDEVDRLFVERTARRRE